MSIYAISDLHLSFGANKPMDIFGQNWEEHYEKIKEDWLKKVNDNDLVLLPGDFSWAMNLKDTYEDFKYLNNLKGQKILLKGNHDYWWTTLKKMNKYLEENNFNNIQFLQNNSYLYDNKYIIVGTRGWEQSDLKIDKKIITREKLRLELSIKEGIKKHGNDKEIIAIMHFPPFEKSKYYPNTINQYIDIMKKYNVKKCIYGHIHSKNDIYKKEEIINGIKFLLSSCDQTDFKLIKIQ